MRASTSKWSTRAPRKSAWCSALRKLRKNKRSARYTRNFSQKFSFKKTPWMPTIDKASAEMIMMTNSLLLIFIFFNRFISVLPSVYLLYISAFKTVLWMNLRQAILGKGIFYTRNFSQKFSFKKTPFFMGFFCCQKIYPSLKLPALNSFTKPFWKPICKVNKLMGEHLWMQF